jgi:serine/threonine-protein kinase RsbW
MDNIDQNVDKVEISFPAKEEYARLLRLTASGIAARMNFSVDGLDDLKIGLDEAFVMAVNDPETDYFDAVFQIYPNRLEVVVAGLGKVKSFEDRMSSKFGFSILDSVMDKIEWVHTGELNQLILVKEIC